MYKIKKVLYSIICLIVLGSFAVAAVGYEKASEKFDKTIVYLGDSICEGILGSSPFSERDSYGYYAIIGRRNNYRYVDRSVSGDTTINMYNRLTRTNTQDLERQYWVEQADIVHISILGNDLLGGNIGKTAIEVFQEDFSNIDIVLARASEYFSLSIARIRELNPDALILVNTVYNPLDAQTTLLTQSQKTEFLELAEGDEEQFRIIGGVLLDNLNSVIYNYLEQNPGSFEIIDVYSVFDDVYNDNYTDGVALIYGDWLHPSNEGHAVMANLIQAKLEELELANEVQAVNKYRTLRIKQLERLFKDTAVDIACVKTKILAAKSCEEISDIYFKSIRGVTPIYTNKPIATPRKGEIFKDTQTFEVSSIKMGADNFISFINTKKSQVVYRDDGTFSIKLAPTSLALGMVNLALTMGVGEGGINVQDALGTGNFGTGLEVYFQEVFPGFDLRDVKGTIELLTSVGVYLNGLDYESQEMISLMNSMEEDLIIPAGFMLPYDLSIEIKGNYFVEKAGDFTNIYMCVGNVSKNGYPFLFATLHTEDDGSSWIETSIEVSKVILSAQEKQVPDNK